MPFVGAPCLLGGAAAWRRRSVALGKTPPFREHFLAVTQILKARSAVPARRSCQYCQAGSRRDGRTIMPSGCPRDCTHNKAAAKCGAGIPEPAAPAPGPQRVHGARAGCSARAHRRAVLKLRSKSSRTASMKGMVLRYCSGVTLVVPCTQMARSCARARAAVSGDTAARQGCGGS